MKKLILMLISLCALPITQTIGSDTAQAKPGPTATNTAENSTLVGASTMTMDNMPDTAFDTLSIEAGKTINYSAVFKKEKSHTYTIYISPDCGSVRCNKKQQKGKSELVTVDCIVTILKNPAMQNIKVILTDVDKKTNELKYRKVLQSYFVKDRPEPVALTSNATSDEDIQAITQAEEESTQKEAVTPAPAEEKPTAPEQTSAKPMDNAMPAQTPPAATDTAAAKDSSQSTTPENTPSATTPTGSESAMPTKNMNTSTTSESTTPSSDTTDTSSTSNDASTTAEQNSSTTSTDNATSTPSETESTSDTSTSSQTPAEPENKPTEPVTTPVPTPTTTETPSTPTPTTTPVAANADMTKKEDAKKPMVPSTGITPIKPDTAPVIPPVPAPTAASTK